MMQINCGELGYQLLLGGQSRTEAKGGDSAKLISGGSLFPKPTSNGCILWRVNDPGCPVDCSAAKRSPNVGSTITRTRCGDAVFTSDEMRPNENKLSRA
jgi:hypothetical protein